MCSSSAFASLRVGYYVEQVESAREAPRLGFAVWSSADMLTL